MRAAKWLKSKHVICRREHASGTAAQLPWGACFMSTLRFDQRRRHVLAAQQLVCGKINEEKRNNLSQVRFFFLFVFFLSPFASLLPLKATPFQWEQMAVFVAALGCFMCFVLRHARMTDEYYSVNWSLGRGGDLIKCWRQMRCTQLVYKSWVAWLQLGIIATVETPAATRLIGEHGEVRNPNVLLKRSFHWLKEGTSRGVEHHLDFECASPQLD